MGKIKNLIIALRKLAMLDQSLANLRFLSKRDTLQQHILTIKEKGVTDEKYCDYNIVVSLTTYGRRLHEVALTIESIMEQTMKANRIILWLSDEEKIKEIPKALQMLQKRGLEIYYCKNIFSYKKLIPTLKLCPNDAIIAIDDDVFYEYDVMENLIVAHLNNPQYIQAHCAHIMEVDTDGNLRKYTDWKRARYGMEPSYSIFPIGVGGVLYPPHCFNDDVFDEETFISICKFGDDIWFKVMAIKNSIKANVVFSHNKYGEDYVINENEQDTGLWNDNVNRESRNDTQLKDVVKRYNINFQV